jgi:glycosyltransferase involved in cell wall biosynthesis
MAGAGVQRSAKFVKYLREYGYNPLVLTVNPVFTNWIKDKTLLNDIPKDIKVFRTPTFDWRWIFKALWGLKLSYVVEYIQNRFLIPDPEISWLPFVKMSLNRIFRERRIDLVFITAGPFASLLLGPYIKRRYLVNYVVDFRDEWTNNPYRNDLKFPLHIKTKNRKLEHEVLSDCSGIVYTLPKYMKENFEGSYAFLKLKPWKTISNGFDETDFKSLSAAPIISNNVLCITYIGTFYGRRNPGLIWQALDELIHNNEIDSNKIRIKIFGKNTDDFVLGKYASNKTLCSIVKLRPNLSYQSALAELIAANALLLYVAPGSNSKAEITGKIFEYMRSYKPVLAFVPPDGVAADILRNAGTGFIYDSAEVTAIKQGLLDFYTRWKEGRLVAEPDKDYIAQYDRRALTKQLADLFDEVLSESAKQNNNE